MSQIGISVDEIDGAIQDVHLDALGNLNMSHDAEAVAQHSKQRIKTFEGEWFLNTAVGAPWLSDIFGKRFNADLSQSIIKSVIRKTEGVSGISSFNIKFDASSRNLIVDGTRVETIYDQEQGL